ncbi:glycosyltransferase [Sporomusa aerivorans]|uniref:glycosyltransferase n=1 Tax=Sporomusa aerivorans TaxID=204936 RepID=UPI003529D68D
MKIAIVSTHLFWGRGGMEKVISSLMGELEQCGDTVSLILCEGANTNWANNYAYYEISSCRGLKRPVFVWQLTRLLNSLNPDIILAVDHRAVFYSRLYRWLRPDSVKIGVWMHVSLNNYSIKHFNNLKFADFYLAISSGMANNLKKRLPVNANKEKIYIVHNPTPLVEYAVPRSTIPIFVYIGRLRYDHDKRVNDFLNALSGVHGLWKALIIGDGPETDKLKRMAVELGISSCITWTGWVNDPWAYVEEASVLVLTSRNEGFGLVLVEALSRGIPCISSNCPDGPADIIEHGKNGWLYPPYSVSELTRLLQMVVDDCGVLPDQYLVKKSMEKFTAKTVMNNIRQILLRQISNKKN